MAVKRFEYLYRLDVFDAKASCRDALEPMKYLLNSLGSEGWELVHMGADFSWFRREI